MLVKYVNSEPILNKTLTLNKSYEVVVSGKHHYTIILENGQKGSFSKLRFEEVK